jgi:hypothetical protein
VPPSTPTYYAATAPPRVPTSWTRPIQIGVAAYYAANGLYAISLPLWMGSSVSQVFNNAMQQQQQLNPDVTPPPPELMTTMTSLINGSIWVGALIAFTIAVLAIVGAMRRWTWVYWAVMVLLGLTAISLPLRFLGAVGGTLSAGNAVQVPAAATVAGIVFGLAGAVLFIAMLIAIISRGPWGMTRPTAWPPPAS